MLKKLTDELAQIKKFDSIDLLKTYGITIDTYSNSNSEASEEEENDTEEVADEWVDRRELGPVRVDDGHHVVWSHNCQSYTCCHF